MEELFNKWTIYCNAVDENKERAFLQLYSLLKKTLLERTNALIRSSRIQNVEAGDFIQELAIAIFSGKFMNKQFNDGEHIINYFLKIVKNGIIKTIKEEEKQILYDEFPFDREADTDYYLEVQSIAKDVIGFGFEDLFMKFKKIEPDCYHLFHRKYYIDITKGKKGLSYMEMVNRWPEYNKISAGALKERASNCLNKFKIFLTKNDF